jgi:hypothetical protein
MSYVIDFSKSHPLALGTNDRIWSGATFHNILSATLPARLLGYANRKHGISGRPHGIEWMQSPLLDWQVHKGRGSQ